MRPGDCFARGNHRTGFVVRSGYNYATTPNQHRFANRNRFANGYADFHPGTITRTYFLANCYTNAAAMDKYNLVGGKRHADRAA